MQCCPLRRHSSGWMMRRKVRCNLRPLGFQPMSAFGTPAPSSHFAFSFRLPQWALSPGAVTAGGVGRRINCDRRALDVDRRCSWSQRHCGRPSCPSPGSSCRFLGSSFRCSDSLRRSLDSWSRSADYSGLRPGSSHPSPGSLCLCLESCLAGNLRRSLDCSALRTCLKRGTSHQRFPSHWDRCASWWTHRWWIPRSIERVHNRK